MDTTTEPSPLPPSNVPFRKPESSPLIYIFVGIIVALILGFGLIIALLVAGRTTEDTKETAEVTIEDTTAAARVTDTGIPAEPAAPAKVVEAPVVATDTEAGCTLNAAFVADVTIPDDTQVNASVAFTKTWKVKNSGTCTWKTGTLLAFVSGEQMGAPVSIVVPQTVPNATVDLTVDFTAPAVPATYRSNWQLKSPEATLFGSQIYVQIVVPVIVLPPVGDGGILIPLRPRIPGLSLGGTTIPDLEIFTPHIDLSGILPQTTEVYATEMIPANSSRSALVACPAGSVVVSGGFAASQDVVVYSHYKESNGWYANGKNKSSEAKQFNVYAICLHNTAGSVTEKGVVAVVNGTTWGKAVASCSDDSLVVGGGFASDPDSHWVYSSSSEGNSWVIYAFNTSVTAKPMNAYAECLSGVSGTTQRVFADVSGGIAAGSSDGARATCPTGSLLTGGGYALGDGLLVYNSSMAQTDSKKWTAYAYNSGTTSSLMYSYGTCLTIN